MRVMLGAIKELYSRRFLSWLTRGLYSRWFAQLGHTNRVRHKSPEPERLPAPNSQPHCNHRCASKMPTTNCPLVAPEAPDTILCYEPVLLRHQTAPNPVRYAKH